MVVREEKMPQLQPLVRELDAGPGLTLSKPRLMVPAPRISLAGIFSLLRKEEAALLEVKVSDEMKKTLPEKSHLLEKEPEK